jgi:hypothetical protein
MINWRIIIPLIGILAGIATFISFVYISWDRFFYEPKHQKIKWISYHPVVNGGNPVKNQGIAPVKEGVIQTTLKPIINKYGQCIVYKENNKLTLQAVFPNTMKITFEERVGERVTTGCSIAKSRKYTLKCCWVD